MSYFKEWTKQMEEASKQKDLANAFWNDYFKKEQDVYKKILAEKENKITGKFDDLAYSYQMKPVEFIGFLDGISESVNQDLPDLDSIEEDTDIVLDINFEKLLWNMHKAKANWLWELPEWNGIFDKEKQKAIATDYKKSKTVRKGPKIGRNDPCPCGSGKKYKKCCGRRQVSEQSA